MENILQNAQKMYQESEALEQRLDFVEQQLVELETFRVQITAIEEGKGEIIASVGKGIFVKADLKKDFFVDVGSGVVINKEFKDIKDIINEQLESLKKLKTQTRERLDELQREFESIINKIKGN